MHDILIIVDNSYLILNKINDFFPLETGSVGKTKTYLGTYTRLRKY